MNYYIADLHFGHKNIILYDRRPFSDVEEMEREITDRWNRTVTRNDDVYVLGDFAYRQEKPVRDYVEALNGRIHLIYGNHDLRTDEYASAFYNTHDTLTIRDDYQGRKVSVTMCHYWMPFFAKSRRGGVMLHGHTHIGEEHCQEVTLKEMLLADNLAYHAYNVGCMFQDYTPWTLEQIIDARNL